jgi:hypothetical protein
MSRIVISGAGYLGAASTAGACLYGDEHVIRLQLLAPKIDDLALQEGVRRVIDLWAAAKQRRDCNEVARLGELARRMLRVAGARGAGTE